MIASQIAVVSFGLQNKNNKKPSCR